MDFKHYQKKPNALKKHVALLAGALGLSLWYYLSPATAVNTVFHHPEELQTLLTDTSICSVPQKLIPEKTTPDIVDISYFRTPEYKNHSLQVWADAVRIYTPSFDDLGPVGEDSRWDVFYELEAYFKKTFPTVHEKGKLEHVNTHGLVYTFEGSDPELKPLMLTGHQDVVPVPEDGISRWKYPPFEAHFDGEWLWGRGASDCKNNVVGIFEAMEKLLIDGFKPKRTVILAFGFDEESSGHEGAIQINKFLKEKYGEKSIFLLVDEGGLGIQDIDGARFAMPSTGEKGYIDVVVKLTTPGGHSSVPPKHTSVGMMSEVVTLIEKEEYPLDLTSKSPYFETVQCQAKYGSAMDADLRKKILKMSQDSKSKKEALETLAQDPTNKALLSTTRAVDIFHGGLKINALPEDVELKINHRVAYDSSIDEVKSYILDCVNDVAEKYGLGVTAFDEELKPATPAGNFVVIAEDALTYAPKTPTQGNPTWELLSGTIKHVFEDFAVYPESLFDPSTPPEVFVAPSCMTGNTDTRHYWEIVDNIYRFSPIRQASRINAHAIDEGVELDAHIEGVAFYYEFVQNVDAYNGN